MSEQVKDRVAKEKVAQEDKKKGPSKVASADVRTTFERDERLYEQITVVCLEKAVHRLEGTAKAAASRVSLSRVIHFVGWWR